MHFAACGGEEPAARFNNFQFFFGGSYQAKTKNQHLYCFLFKICNFFNGTPVRTRTSNVLLRRRLLYPIELRGGLSVKFSVSAKGDEINGIGIYFFIHRTDISCNINTAALFIFSVERVIIEKWVKGIFPKNLDSLVCFSLVCVLKSPVSLVEISMKNNPHGFR